MLALIVVSGLTLAMVVCVQLHAWPGAVFIGVVFCAGILKSLNEDEDA